MTIKAIRLFDGGFMNQQFAFGGEGKARKSLKLPMFRQYKGIIALMLNPEDGVVKQTGVHRSHYTWWRTRAFTMLNQTMLSV